MNADRDIAPESVPDTLPREPLPCRCPRPSAFVRGCSQGFGGGGEASGRCMTASDPLGSSLLWPPGRVSRTMGGTAPPPPKRKNLEFEDAPARRPRARVVCRDCPVRYPSRVLAAGGEPASRARRSAPRPPEPLRDRLHPPGPQRRRRHRLRRRADCSPRVAHRRRGHRGRQHRGPARLRDVGVEPRPRPERRRPGGRVRVAGDCDRVTQCARLPRRGRRPATRSRARPGAGGGDLDPGGVVLPARRGAPRRQRCDGVAGGERVRGWALPQHLGNSWNRVRRSPRSDRPLSRAA